MYVQSSSGFQLWTTKLEQKQTSMKHNQHLSEIKNPMIYGIELIHGILFFIMVLFHRSNIQFIEDLIDWVTKCHLLFWSMVKLINLPFFFDRVHSGPPIYMHESSVNKPLSIYFHIVKFHSPTNSTPKTSASWWPQKFTTWILYVLNVMH